VDGQRRLCDVEQEAVESRVDRVISLLGVSVQRRRRAPQAAEVGVELPARTLPLRGALRAGALGPWLRRRVRLGRAAAPAAA
jgi:hypothetical protein